MPRVVALYRYPVKSFTPESCTALEVLPEGRVAGDRVLGFRFANSPFADDAWSRKYEFVALVNTPALARLALQFDHRALRLRITHQGDLLAEAGLDDAGRKRLSASVGEYVLAQDENPLSGHPERLPLRLIGNGVTPRYQDNETGQVTLHSRASLAAVAAAANETGMNELRFRSNIVIEGVSAWEEQSWIGRRLRIGRLANLVATNVPGPPGPRFLCEAKVEALHPIVPIVDGIGLGIAVFSYAGWLQIGINADAAKLDDVEKLQRGIEEAFEALLAAS